MWETFIILGSFFVGLAIGSMLEVEHAEEQAIAHQCAYYDQQTREFTWLMPEIKNEP